MNLTVSLEKVCCPETLHWQGSKLTLGELLGVGTFSSVRAVTVCPVPNQTPEELKLQRAEGSHEMAARITDAKPTDDELAVLATLVANPHPHIVRLFGSVFIEARWHVLLLERAHGGELFERVQQMEGERARRCTPALPFLCTQAQCTHVNPPTHEVRSPLRLAFRTPGGFDERLAARWCRELLSAVEHLHRLDVVHRDLKPENLLLASEAADSALKV